MREVGGGQSGSFDLNRLFEGLDVNDDPLVAIAAMVPFEPFRSMLKAAPIAIANSARRGRPPTPRTSKVGARAAQVFGDQNNGMGAAIVRPIGIVRARCKIGMTTSSALRSPLHQTLFDGASGSLRSKGWQRPPDEPARHAFR